MEINDNQSNIIFCSVDERKWQRFGTTRRWIHFYFWVPTVPWIALNLINLLHFIFNALSIFNNINLFLSKHSNGEIVCRMASIYDVNQAQRESSVWSICCLGLLFKIRFRFLINLYLYFNMKHNFNIKRSHLFIRILTFIFESMVRTKYSMILYRR